MALRAWIDWCLGKPIEVRIATLSSGGWMPMKEDKVGKEGSASAKECTPKGSAKSVGRE